MNEIRLQDFFDLDPVDSLMRGLPRPWRLAAADDGAPQMRIDLSEDDGAYALKAEIPGVSKDDIEVRIDGRQVTLSAEIKQDQQTRENGGRVLRSERRYGYASRSFALDSPVDESRAEAHYRNGVLELRLPKKAGAAGARKLAIAG